MKKIFRNIACVCALFMALTGAQAQGSLSELRELCPAGKSIKVAQSLTVQGIVVSDYRSPNMELNPNTGSDAVDTGVNNATAYLQEPDGSMGVRVIFTEPGENRLCRYDHAVLDLAGCTVTREKKPDRISISGLSYRNVVSVVPGSPADIQPKIKHIAELKDSDTYTYVTLTDAEMVFKNGGYTDIYEPYMQYQECIQGDHYAVSERMDGWAALVRDSEGSAIYMLVGTLCPWRRNLVPAGAGNLSGIIVNTNMPRYGGNMGRFSIRPVDEKDIAMPQKKNSPWKLLTGWIMDGTNGQKLTFELMGEVDGLWKNGKNGDRVLSDAGAKAFLWTDSNADIHVDNDLNALDVSEKGFVHNGAILFKSPTTAWYSFDGAGTAKDPKSFLMEFSGKKAKGTQMALSFSWSAGDQRMDHDWGFPVHWKVMCSVNDSQWVALRETATGQEKFSLRGQPYWDGKSALKANGHNYQTGFDCGMGNQQRSFLLPAEAIGAAKVVLRITPADSYMYSLRKVPSTSGETKEKITRSFEGTTIIRFGEIKVEYK